MVESILTKSISLLDFVAFAAADRKEAGGDDAPLRNFVLTKMVQRFAALPGEPLKLADTPTAFGNIDNLPREDEMNRYFNLLELNGLQSEKEMYDKVRETINNSPFAQNMPYDPGFSSEYKEIESKIKILKSELGITDDSWREEIKKHKLFPIIV